MATVKIDLDLPEGVEVRSYERVEDGHALEVSWPLPDQVACEQCGRQEAANIRWKENTVYVCRDLDLWNQPSFFVYQPPFHQCSRCGRRQEMLPPFKRKHVTYTYRFEEWVIQLLTHATEEDVARRLGISAETVGIIVQNQLRQARAIDPKRKITDVGIDEISLKKRHKLYVTVLTDLTDPAQPRVLAVVEGRDQTAAEKALDCLSPQQRAQVRAHRTDMSAAYTAAGAAKLPHSQQVIDRFHVAKSLGQAVDTVRKKMTRAYKRRLSAQERREFRSQMWAFRSRPERLSDSQRAGLKDLFGRIPELEFAYNFRKGMTEIFDTACDADDAARQIEEYRSLLKEEHEELRRFFQTFDAHREGILAYFHERKTSGVVEGINNKARVITKRCYGVKTAQTLWNRLCLDINMASRAVSRTVKQMRELKAAIRATFSPVCT